MRHLKIKVKLLLGFALVGILTIIVGLVGTVGLTTTDKQYNEMLDSNIAAISSVADMSELFQKQRSQVRSIILDTVMNPEKIQTDIDSLRSYEAALEKAMALYENAVANHSSGDKDYLAAKEAYFSVYASMKKEIEAAVLLGDYKGAMATLTAYGPSATQIAEDLQATVDHMGDKVASDSADLTDNAMRMVVIQVVVMISAGICSIILGLYISAIISKPIKTMSDFFVRFGTAGDLLLTEDDKKNIEVNSKNRDEIGQCVNGAAMMYGRLVDIKETLNAVADGDLTVDMKVLSDKDELGLSVVRMTESLNKIFGELRAASGQVSSGAEQISQGAQGLASGATQQAASIEEFSSTIAGMQDKTGRNAENSINAVRVNEEIGAKIEESVSSMALMLEAMKDIDESSKSITRVIKVIDDIAFQTNILALNAAVEAARAGIHGKGFAVVADEVRNLASKSAAAAKETAALIEGSSEKVREGNQIVNKTNLSLEAVASGSKEVIRLIGEVSTASTEQAVAIKEVNQGIEQISGVVQENTASAEESAAASQEMSAQAVMLNEIVARFKLKQPVGGALESHVAERQIFSGENVLPTIKDAMNYDEKYR